MNLITETKQYFLTPNGASVTKNNGNYNSDITYYIPNFITNENNILYYSVKISHAEIPYSFYIIDETNNQLVINNTTMYINIGNYNAYTLMEEINKLLDDAFNFNIVLSFNENTGKYTLSSNNYFTISNQTTIYDIIGLDNNFYNSVFDFGTTTYILEFPYLVNTSGSKNIYIESNLITNNLSLLNNNCTILKSIPVDVPPYGIIMYNNAENIETVIKNRQLDNLIIKLKDDTNKMINFNNVNWSITLELKLTKQLTLNTFSFNDYFNNNNIENSEK
jgi:hypothetical protein